MDVAEELIEPDERVDRAYIERRLDDWRDRLGHLYTAVTDWLDPAWSLVDTADVPIHEELMERFDVPRQWLPAKALLRGTERAGLLTPRGLWIIGANGRLDLTLPNKHFIIIDRAQSFEQPQWKITPLRDRLDSRVLDAETFRASLR